MMGRLLWANLLATARNPMALIYGWLFPLIFLAGFVALYGDDPVPLALHAGQFFTITILGSAAFGLPTQMVSEREAGLWRHFALTPAPRWRFVVALVLARAALLAGALLLQHWAARALGMPPLPHPASTILALMTAGLCFLCLGALIGNLAPNVPAVQALGQCIFLPMLILGGVAVPLASLPDWALPWSNLLPGRHAVVAIQTAVTGTGTQAAEFELLALVGHGLLALLAAVLLFRWEPAPLRLGRRGWGLVPLIALWLALVAVAHGHQRSVPTAPDAASASQAADYARPRPQAAAALALALPVAPPAAAPAVVPPPAAAPPVAAATDDLAAALDGVAFERLPPDSGLVAPVAVSPPDAVLEGALARIQRQLAAWPPARSGSEEQQVRNLLLIAAVPDLLQIDPLERHLPLLVEAQLQARFAPPALQRLLLAIALHPDAGSVSVRADLPALGLPAHVGPEQALRGRVMLYAFKLLGRSSGRRVGDPSPPDDKPEPDPA
jgi:hypothetical protein